MPGLGQRLGVPVDDANALAATVLPGMGWGGRYNALAASAGELAERAALAFPTDAEAMAYRTLRARRGILPSGEEQQLAQNYQSKMMQLAMAGLTVWHGSPTRFPPTKANPLGEFDSSKIGTGQGAQAYGHGLYMAENPNVAKQYNPNARTDITSDVYRKSIKYWEKRFAEEPTTKVKAELDDVKAKLSSNMEANSIYKVDLPDEQIAKMLDWDKPLSQQSESVRKALVPLTTRLQSEYDKAASLVRGGKSQNIGNLTGRDLAERILGGGEKASAQLRELGIPGIKYLDQGSRTAGRWTRQDVKDAFKDWRAKVGQPEEQAAFEIWREMKRAHKANPATRNFVVFPGNENLLKILERQ